MPAPTPIAAAWIVIRVTCSIALAQPVDLRAPTQTTGARSFAPSDPYSAIAPQSPVPPVRENDRPHAFLEAAWSAVDRGQSEEAQDALEPAKTRLHDRYVATDSTQESDDRRVVLDIGVTQQALAARDRPGALRAIDDALAAADPVALAAQPLPPSPPPVAGVTRPPPGPPPVTYALLPGHWQLEGARYVWMPPETTLRRVEARPLIEGRYVWRDREWHWVPAHYEDN